MRRRALVLLRRYLLLAAVAALLAEVGIWLTGGEPRTWWLLAPPMVALVGFVIAMRRGVTVAQTASMIDAGLALRNRVATAVELAKLEAGAGRETAAGHASAALAERVNAEASAAVSESFVTARLRDVGAPREWAALGGAAFALALALAFVPAGRVVGAAQGGRGVHGFSGNGTGAQHRGGRDGRLGTHVAPTRTTIAVPLARPRRSSTPVNRYLPQLIAEQLKKEELASAEHRGTPGFKQVKATRSHGAAGEPGSANGAQQNRAGSSHGLPSHLGSKISPLGTPTKLPRHATVPTRGSRQLEGNPHSGAPTGTSKAGSASSRSQQASAIPPGPNGGEQAGTAPGSQALGKGLTPDLQHRSTGLPLQAGYAPSLAKHGSNGRRTSQTPNGNGHGGNTARAFTESGAGGTGFAVIPPSSNAGSAANRTQRDNYFGDANELQLKHW